VTFAVGALALLATLTTPAPDAAAQTFRTGVNLVILPVTVTNSDGRFVGALTKNDFTVYEDNHERPIEQFSSERVPVSLGILIDISGSMLGARFADAQIELLSGWRVEQSAISFDAVMPLRQIERSMALQ